MPLRSSLGWPLAWTLLFMGIILLEGIALGRPEAGDSLSEVVRNQLRFDQIGRFVLLPLWCWLSWHWILRPPSVQMFTRWDVLAVVAGFGWAFLESRR